MSDKPRTIGEWVRDNLGNLHVRKPGESDDSFRKRILRITHQRKPWIAANRVVTQTEFANLPDWDRVMLVCGELELELDDFSTAPSTSAPHPLLSLRYAVPSHPDELDAALNLPVMLRGAEVVDNGSGAWLRLTVGPEVWRDPEPAPSQPAIKATEQVRYVHAWPELTPESSGHEHGFEWYWYSPEQRNGPRLYVRVCSGVPRSVELHQHALELFARLLLGEEPG